MALDTRRLRHPWLFAVLGIVVGIGFGVGTFQEWRRDQGLREHGRETTGTVVEVTSPGKKGSKVFVEFETADGRRVRSEVEGRLKTSGTKVGDTFPIRYNGRRPEGDVYDARVTDQHRILYLGVVLTVVAFTVPPLLAFIALRRRRRGSKITY